jgi:hypothetical protein
VSRRTGWGTSPTPGYNKRPGRVGERKIKPIAL